MYENYLILISVPV